MNPFAFDANDPIYTQPRMPVPDIYYPELSQTQRALYAGVDLTFFDRTHLSVGVRYSDYEVTAASYSFCREIPTEGEPSPDNCVGREIGDPYGFYENFVSGDSFTWPPRVAVSYDLKTDLTAYLSYSDIYQDQSRFLTVEREPVGPLTGANYELGLKWSPWEGRINASAAAFRIEQENFFDFDNENYVGEDEFGNQIFRNAAGEEFSYADANLYCCFRDGFDVRKISEGFDFDLTGELLSGLNVSANYTFNTTSYDGNEDDVIRLLLGGNARARRVITTQQPEHLYKIWLTVDAALIGLDRFKFGFGVNGQSSTFFFGSVCPNPGSPNVYGVSGCSTPLEEYEFTQGAYAVWSASASYELNDRWSISANFENLLDQRYYKTNGTSASGNWYGEPASTQIAIRARW